LEHQVNLDYIWVHPKRVLHCHEELRRHFEPHIRATQELPEVRVFASVCLRLVRLAKARVVLAKEGLNEESQLPLRSATEAIANLLYIMYAGPATGDKSQRDLALQFLAYGDVEYFKMLKRRPIHAKNAFSIRLGLSDSQFDTFMQEKKQLSDDAVTIHGCTKRNWHNLDLASLAIKVKDNIPCFVHKDIADFAFSSFVSSNNAVHASALSLRKQYAACENAPLELVYDEDNTVADIIFSFR